ncbi:MAG: hypothetical protein QM493_09840 [Sulfurovum sp.]
MQNLNLSKQLPRNLIINIFSFSSTLLIGLWLTPYLLKSLGIIAYGLIPLAMFFSQYISVILNAINISINRFLIISLQKNQDEEANQIFNTSLVVVFSFIIFQFLIMSIVIFDINLFFNIPDALIFDAMWLFGLTFVGFSISLVRAIFATSLFAYNRVDILRIIDIFQNIIRLLTIIILFVYDEPSLKYVGVANLLASLFVIFPTLYYFKIYTPQLKINLSFFNIKYLSKLSKMSLWVLINQVGVLLLGNIDLYMVNNLIGIKATSEYAIVVQITSIFKTLLLLLSGILTPVIMIYYANGEFKKLNQFIIISSKVMVVGMIVPLAIIIGLSSQIINLWLGEEYIYLYSYISFSLLYFTFVIPVIPLFNITVAYNKVKLPAIIALYLGAINIISIYILVVYTNLELWGVISVKFILEFIFTFFIIIYVSKILSLSFRKLFQTLGISLLSFIILSLILKIIIYFIDIDSFVKLLLLVMTLSIIIYPTMIIFIFTKEEKRLLFDKYTILQRLFL